jgi:multicomponent Na+:H+ antiporter subunit G
VSWLTLASDLLIAAGLLFIVTGAVGLYRMPDFFTRTHAAGITDSAGAGLVLLGLLLRIDGFAEALRLLLIALFLLFTSPTATHALAQSALEDGLRPLLDDRRRHR